MASAAWVGGLRLPKPLYERLERVQAQSGGRYATTSEALRAAVDEFCDKHERRPKDDILTRDTKGDYE